MAVIVAAFIVMVIGIINVVVGWCKKNKKTKRIGAITVIGGVVAGFIFTFIAYENSQPQIYTTNGDAVENNYICIKAGWKEEVYYTLEQYADPAVDGIKYTEPIPITGSVAVSAKSRLLGMKWSGLAVRYILVKDGKIIILTDMPKVNVPNVVGSDRATAEKILTDNGLKVNVSEEYSDSVAAGIVISQTVEAGTSVDNGSTVGIVVSKGQENAGVPNVVGFDRNSAISALEAAGFKVSEGASQYSDSVTEGYVISQDIAGGSAVKNGSTVTIIVSKGQEMVTVPSVIGLTYSAAESQLSQHGLIAARGSEEYSATVQAGSVVSQSVSAGSSTTKNTTVILSISMGLEMVEVPNVTGIQSSSAESQLNQSGFAVSYGSAEYSDEPEGNVIRQSESAGGKLAKGSTVTIVVSKGRQPFTISFNSDGGTGIASVTMRKGDTLSNANLPVSTKDYNNFGGWTYNGAGVDGMTVTGDMTLTAAWSAKAVCDWVAVGSAPEGANIVDNKWTYTVTTTEITWSRGDVPLDDQGYVRTGNEEWKLNSSGESFYCNGFPDGEFKNNTGLASSVPWTAASNDIYRLDVTTDWAGYVYWHWMYDSGGTEYGQYTRNISQRSGYGTAIKNFYYKYYGEFTSTSDYQKGSSGYNNNTGWTTYVNTGRTSYAENQGTDRWFRFDYYKASFEEYYKYIEYSLTTVNSYETTTGEPSGDGVGNIVHLVRYIPR